MSTIYKWNDSETAVAAGDLTPTDMVLVFDTSAGTMKKAVMSDLAGGHAGGVVNTTATTLQITAALHANRTVTINSAAPIIVTLPQATGTGNIYHFIWQTAATGTASTIKVGNTTDCINGICTFLTTTSDAFVGFLATATDDTITVNGTTKGGVATGQWWIRDVKTGTFAVSSLDKATGTILTPFSAGV